MTRHYAFTRVNKHGGFLTAWFWMSWLQSQEYVSKNGLPVSETEILDQEFGYAITERAAKRRARRKMKKFRATAVALDGS